MTWLKKLHNQIVLGLILGLVFGIVSAMAGWGQFTQDWIAPFGRIFLKSLFLIAVPLVLASIITGVASLSDTKKLSRIGGKTIAIYISTTVAALIIGLVLVNIMRPGDGVPENVKEQLNAEYADMAEERAESANDAMEERGPLQAVVDMVPDNIFGASSSNRNMLQVVFVAILFGIALLMLPDERAQPLLSFFGSLNDLVIKIVELIMKPAPIGVFALLADHFNLVSAGDLVGLR